MEKRYGQQEEEGCYYYSSHCDFSFVSFSSLPHWWPIKLFIKQTKKMYRPEMRNTKNSVSARIFSILFFLAARTPINLLPMKLLMFGSLTMNSAVRPLQCQFYSFKTNFSVHCALSKALVTTNWQNWLSSSKLIEKIAKKFLLLLFIKFMV